MPLKVLLARLSPCSTASCQLLCDAAVILLTRATAMVHLRMLESGRVPAG
jgi:hypothetical protein